MLNRGITALSSLLATLALESSSTFVHADTAAASSGTAATLSILHSFTGGVSGSSDGAFPSGALIQGSDGNLYGMTTTGGQTGVPPFQPQANVFGLQLGGPGPNPLAPGAIFKVSLQGAETLLHAFGSPGLLDNLLSSTNGLHFEGIIEGSDGNFYGHSPHGCGGVFKVTPDGTQSDLYASPSGSIFDDDYQCVSVVEPGVIQGSDGNLYATTAGGNFTDPISGMDDDVSVPSQLLQIPLAGLANGSSPAVVASFGIALPSNNQGVATTLIQGRDGNFYETISAGSVLANGNPAILQITPAGIIHVLYAFANSAQTASQLILANDGNLYGTTVTGGATSTACPSGCGTVFQLTLSGAFTVLYSFGATPTDGQTPSGPLIQASDGNLYGLTSAGGSGTSSAGINSRTCSNGCGTVYQISTAGIETVIYSFGSFPTDGSSPIGALLQATDGNLYGVTQTGGVEQLGTVFKLVLAGH